MLSLSAICSGLGSLESCFGLVCLSSPPTAMSVYLANCSANTVDFLFNIPVTVLLSVSKIDISVST